MKFLKSVLLLGVLSLSQLAFSQGIGKNQRVTCTSPNHDVIAVFYYNRQQVPIIQLTVKGKAEFPVALMGSEILGGVITQLVSADQSNDYNAQLIMDIKAQSVFAQLRVAHLKLLREGKNKLNCYVK